MDKAFWLRRQQESSDMAQSATSSAARLIHLEVAGRYSIEAANVELRLHLPVDSPVTSDGGVDLPPRIAGSNSGQRG